MAVLYEDLIADSVLERDQGVLDAMRAKNDDEIKKLDEK
jgi:26S proteasome regulatory subunit N7